MRSVPAVAYEGFGARVSHRSSSVCARRRGTESHAVLSPAPEQLFAHELCGQLLQRGEVERVSPLSGEEPAEQIFDHPTMGEQALAGRVVHGCTVVSSRRRGSGREARKGGGVGLAVCGTSCRRAGCSSLVAGSGSRFGAGVPGGHQQTVAFMAHHLPAPGDVGRDDRAPAGRGLEQRLGQSLPIAGQHRDVRARQDIGYVLAISPPLDESVRRPGLHLLR